MKMKLAIQMLIIFATSVCYLIIILLIPTFLYQRLIHNFEAFLFKISKQIQFSSVKFVKSVENIFGLLHT